LHAVQPNGSPSREGSFAHIFTNTLFKEYQNGLKWILEGFDSETMLSSFHRFLYFFKELCTAVSLFENNLILLSKKCCALLYTGTVQNYATLCKECHFENYCFARHILEDFAFEAKLQSPC
jgi:hypothetical protein